MLKSPEQYLSEMNFDLSEDGNSAISSGERAFIEKYLGQDALNQLKPVDPVPQFVPIKPQPQVRFKEADKPLARKTIEVVPDKKPEQVRAPEPKPAVSPPKPAEVAVETKQEATSAQKQSVKIETEQKAATTAKPVLNAKIDVQTKVEGTSSSTATIAKQEIEIKAATQHEQKAAVKPPVAEAPPKAEVKAAPPKAEVKVTETVAPPVQKATLAAEKATTPKEAPSEHPSKLEQKSEARVEMAAQERKAAPIEARAELQLSLKDKLKQEDEIQMVSFLVSGQLFLLPVAAIQEVLRHMELVKVPQAPDFVAGVINLRGRVTPLVYLSSLLTDNVEPSYTEKNFIIICGGDNLQLGLIIDRIKSMHMLPQDKIIWNVESKLGDSAEFLMAIANLDDKVCGIIAPEAITQKIIGAM